MSTTPAVAATSLSELNELAANPPQYPHNPTERLREPLTLYISRVPGTRDVILSTLKPQRKNVTAEDIANALYYIHLDLPSDSLLVSSTSSGREASNFSPRSSFDQPRTSSIHRKPLPAKLPRDDAPLSPLPGPETNETVPASPTPSQSTSQSLYEPQPPPLPPRPAPSQDVPPLQPPRPPRQPWVPPGFRLDEDHQFEAVKAPEIVTAVEVAQPSPSPAVQLRPRPSISRKPVGPRTVGNGNSNPQDARPIGLITATSNTSLASYSSQTTIDTQKQQRPLSPLSPRSPVFVPFQLTLIRRDPSSNHQWNIGKISSLQVIDPPASSFGSPDSLDASVAARDQTQQQQQQQQQPQATISIRLDSSGYAKFRGFPRRRNAETAPRDMAAVLQDLAREGRPEPRDESGFSRQVVMSYGKSWTANLRNAFRRHDRSSSDTTGLDGDAEPQQQQQQQQQQQKRQRPVSHMPTSNTATVDVPQPLITRPGPGLKPRGYVFASPWGGQCEFRTGNGGRSLKCRHYLHNDGGGSGGGEGGGGGGRSAGFNPLVLAQNIRDGQSMTTAAVNAAGGRATGGSFTDVITGAAPVSELRFNLPNSDVLRGGKAEDGSGSSRPDLYGWRYHRQSTSSDDGDADDYEDDDDETLAVAMGREPAGGGNRGKRAKLGKLIIYNEGFKMLDLIVAANIGMWWVSWDKSF
ncbi:hypothetical protein CMQ_1540 [Grosmannia clavigera kw1407]|uniref:Oxidoreductase-like protein n=1 Tax=Grosmannia clavigera (strain kw1407 / UAMH 11150) TaxID=655863 RepID=F0XF75_GROCL|nr:uncharacterized protein CMQ_1540 [Grosmannia clavigera kw1407]EFX04612.1 hypothetical protein CMQ_1540 [Grosmannia clavigera kw1407]